MYLSPRLSRSVRISGRILVDLQASLDRPDANLTALLVDYGEGDEFPRASESASTLQRETCWGESSKQDDACYRETRIDVSKVDSTIVSRGWLDARHHESERRNTPVIPDSVYSFKWDIFGDDYAFARGHRIGLVIAGSDQSFTIPDPMGATVTVELGASTLTLPVVGGASRLAS